MSEFVWWAALIAGFIATMAMSLMMNAAKLMGATGMPAMSLILGSLFTGASKRAKVLGVFGHSILMGTLCSACSTRSYFVSFGAQVG